MSLCIRQRLLQSLAWLAVVEEDGEVVTERLYSLIPTLPTVVTTKSGF